MNRVGYAKDIHRLVEDRKLILAGVDIPFEKGLLGHSDADVVLHAITESILGALALGDLGKIFPNTDPKYYGFDSGIMLSIVVSVMEQMGYEVGNVDVSIVLEKPKLAPYIGEMRQNVARLLKTSIRNVSIKAGTNEGVGELGANEACEAVSYILLISNKK